MSICQMMSICIGKFAFKSTVKTWCYHIAYNESMRFLEINKKLTSIHQELSLLSSDYSDNQQVSQAIELARKGSSTKIIVEQTGLSPEDADAIVRFHGQN